MRDVLPLTAYESGSLTSFIRTALIVAVLWDVPMTLFMLRTHQGSVGFVVTIGAIGAVIFGTLITILIRFARRMLTQQVYYCMYPIVPAAPPGNYEARLMCSLVRGFVPVGGHLYIGPEIWAFVPHVRNGPVYRKPVKWERPKSLSFDSIADDRVTVSDGAIRFVFIVPDAKNVVTELEKAAR